MKTIKIVLALLAICTLTACPGGKDGPMEEEEEEGGDPSSAKLVFPDNNSECTEGVKVNDLESTITFQWETSPDTDSYELNVRNLNFDSTVEMTATSNEAAVTLASNTPYEWFVVSKMNGGENTATSAKWQFYNAGEGVLNYAPFPAEAVSPKRGESISATSTVTLEWQGNDVDDDIEDFEVFFGTDNNPTTSLGNTAQSSMNTNVSSGQTYYWRVVTKDKAGNSSESEIFDFKVL